MLILIRMQEVRERTDPGKQVRAEFPRPLFRSSFLNLNNPFKFMH